MPFEGMPVSMARSGLLAGPGGDAAARLPPTLSPRAGAGAGMGGGPDTHGLGPNGTVKTPGRITALALSRLKMGASISILGAVMAMPRGVSLSTVGPHTSSAESFESSE